jgi:hypothetical protein
VDLSLDPPQIDNPLPPFSQLKPYLSSQQQNAVLLSRDISVAKVHKMLQKGVRIRDVHQCFVDLWIG